MGDLDLVFSVLYRGIYRCYHLKLERWKIKIGNWKKKNL